MTCTIYLEETTRTESRPEIIPVGPKDSHGLDVFEFDDASPSYLATVPIELRTDFDELRSV